MKMKNPRFIIEGFIDDENDGYWETIACCNDPVIVPFIIEGADNFLRHQHIEVSERQPDGTYNYISLRTLESYK